MSVDQGQPDQQWSGRLVQLRYRFHGRAMSCQEEGRNQAVEVTKGVPGGNSGRLIDKENPTGHGYPARQ